MGVMKIQSATAVEAEESLYGKECIRFFCRRLQIKRTGHCRVNIRISVVEKGLEVGITMAEL
jgi:hypothetical protein